ncbi:alginate export family protein [Confluentibacter sediminis]|uniref:alginate export family protein n=1 Tax=Confluentibacter sediminis TaxID=2219045 RepID=UPI000DAE5D0B|nr:alginate export family protein [Confluentibacter sediminis]
MKRFCFLILLMVLNQVIFSQNLELSAEIRPRYEFRNGYKSLIDDGQEPASFVSQRSRLNIGFEQDKLQLILRVQDVRVWGDVATNMSNSSNSIAIFEGYAQYNLNSLWSFKIGRQVLSYDDQRIMGEVDWAQQGRSHDAFLISFAPNKKHHLDVGISVSSQKETIIETNYDVNNYKNMQFSRYEYNLDASYLSFLFLNNGFQFEQSDSDLVTLYLQTFGVFYKVNKFKWSGEFSIYGQTGELANDNIFAWYAGGFLKYNVADDWQIGIGGEYLSGTAMDDTSGKNKSFNPLFGTNHKFNGYMDYFYVGNHINSVGLLDAYANLKFARKKFNLTITPHLFSAAETVLLDGTNKMTDYLGTEIDLVANYKLQKDINLNAGYSQLFASNTMEVLKGGNVDKTQNWAWIMVVIKPELFSLTK